MGCGSSKIELEPVEVKFYGALGLKTDDVDVLYKCYQNIDVKNIGFFSVEQWLGYCAQCEINEGVARIWIEHMDVQTVIPKADNMKGRVTMQAFILVIWDVLTMPCLELAGYVYDSYHHWSRVLEERQKEAEREAAALEGTHYHHHHHHLGLTAVQILGVIEHLFKDVSSASALSNAVLEIVGGDSSAQVSKVQFVEHVAAQPKSLSVFTGAVTRAKHVLGGDRYWQQHGIIAETTKLRNECKAATRRVLKHHHSHHHNHGNSHDNHDARHRSAVTSRTMTKGGSHRDSGTEKNEKTPLSPSEIMEQDRHDKKHHHHHRHHHHHHHKEEDGDSVQPQPPSSEGRHGHHHHRHKVKDEDARSAEPTPVKE